MEVPVLHSCSTLSLDYKWSCLSLIHSQGSSNCPKRRGVHLSMVCFLSWLFAFSTVAGVFHMKVQQTSQSSEYVTYIWLSSHVPRLPQPHILRVQHTWRCANTLWMLPQEQQWWSLDRFPLCSALFVHKTAMPGVGCALWNWEVIQTGGWQGKEEEV